MRLLLKFRREFRRYKTLALDSRPGQDIKGSYMWENFPELPESSGRTTP